MTKYFLDFIILKRRRAFPGFYRNRWSDVSGFSGRITPDRWAELRGIGITKEEDIKLKNSEKEIKRDKATASKSIFEIHTLAYKKTGLKKNLEKFVIRV